MRLLYSGLILLTSMQAFAWTDQFYLKGRTLDGWYVSVAVEDHEKVSFVGKSKDPVHQRYAGFNQEPCLYKGDSEKTKGHELTCAANGKSPLAGTKYIGEYFNRRDKNGKSCGEYVFHCVEGCSKKGSFAPKELRGWWVVGDCEGFDINSAK